MAPVLARRSKGGTGAKSEAWPSSAWPNPRGASRVASYGQPDFELRACLFYLFAFCDFKRDKASENCWTRILEILRPDTIWSAEPGARKATLNRSIQRDCKRSSAYLNLCPTRRNATRLFRMLTRRANGSPKRVKPLIFRMFVKTKSAPTR